MHQFEKVEQFCVTVPDGDESWKMQEEMLANSEEFYKSLGLPYRVARIPPAAPSLLWRKHTDPCCRGAAPSERGALDRRDESVPFGEASAAEAL